MILVVGINSMHNDQSGWNSTHRRLARWMATAGVDLYSFVNCIPDVDGPLYNPSQVNYKWLGACGAREYKRVVALGPLPSAALARMRVRHYVLPHPSGRNRLLNDPAFEVEMVRRLGVYITEGVLPVRDDETSVIGTVQGGLDLRLHPRDYRPAHRRGEHRLRKGVWLKA